MTNKEAIERLSNKLNVYGFTAEDNEALDMAIKALEETDTGLQEQNNLFCPRCHVATVISDVLRINYCPYCGAKMFIEKDRKINVEDEKADSGLLEEE